MKSLKNFFVSYRKALDTFASSLTKAVQVYEKEVIFKGNKGSNDNILVDSQSTALGNVKMCLDEMVRGV
jgi:hypothetical protein